MSAYNGRVIWRETMTTDAAKAKRFYGELFNWSFDEMDMGPAGTYTIVKVDGKGIGGIMATMGGAPPAWVSYVYVQDVDASAAATKAGGGSVPWGPTDIPGVGRLAVLVDAEGACIAVMKPSEPDQPRDPNHRAAAGEFCWETLTARDVATAKAHYTKVMPWRVGTGAGMETFGVGDGPGDQIADLQRAEGQVPPHWLTFVVVAGLEASAARAERLGGRVVVPAMPIPGIGRMAVVADDQGAHLGLFERGA